MMLTVLKMTVLQSYQLTTLIHFLKVPFQRKWVMQSGLTSPGVTSGLTEQMQVSPADHLSVDALHYLAGYVAFKLKRQHPDLGQVSSQISSVPVTCRMWLPCLSRGGLRIPSDGWFRAVEQLENDFRAHHGSGLRKEKMLLHR